MLTEHIQSNQYIRLASRLDSLIWYGSFIPGDVIDYNGLWGDSIRGHLANYEYPMEPLYLPQLLGRYPYAQENHERKYGGFLNQKADHDSFDHIRIRAANAYNVKALLSGRWDSFATGDIPKIPGENVVSHWNPVGTVLTNVSAGDLLRPSDDVDPKPFPTTLDVSTYASGVRYTWDSFQSISTGSAGVISESALQWMKTHCENGGYDAHAPHGPSNSYYLSYSNFSYSYGETLNWVSYQIRTEPDWVPGNLYRLFTITLTPQPSNPVIPPYPLADGPHLLSSLVECRWLVTIDWTFTNVWWDPISYTVPVTYENFFVSDVYGRFDQNLAENRGFAGVWDADIIGRSRLLRRFQNAVEPVLPDCATACSLSTADALETHFPKLEANFLETFSDLNDLSSLINPRALSDAYELVTKKKSRSAKSLLDVLTDAKLTYEFGVVPTVSDAEQLALRGKSILNRYKNDSLFGRHVINGKFIYDIPDGTIIGFDGCTLVARSKLVINFGDQAILSAIMPVRAFGVLPSLSNLWDLTRYSFAIDWFFNLGDRFGLIDSQAMLFASDVYYSCHSIQILWNIPAETLLNDGCFSPDGSAALSFYSRTLMKSNPTYVSNRFDFFKAQGPSDWGTAGSFFYKVITK